MTKNRISTLHFQTAQTKQKQKKENPFFYFNFVFILKFIEFLSERGLWYDYCEQKDLQFVRLH